jgi:hypothetical protein
MRVIGYGVCGPGEADRYMEATLKEFGRLCDETVICGNNITEKERKLIEKYGFQLVEDNREWGKNQWRLKEDLVNNHVAKLNPDFLICLDMDEVFDTKFTRESFKDLEKLGWAYSFFIANLWDDGYNDEWSFWNVRAWKWNGDTRWAQKPLHCGLAPEWTYQSTRYAPYIVKHYGLKEKKDRDRKIQRYAKYDPNAKYIGRAFYDALTRDHSVEFNEDKLHNKVESEVKRYKQEYKEPRIMEDKKYVVIMRESDGMTFSVEEKKADRHMRKGFRMIGTKKPAPKVEKEVEEAENTCEDCGFVAKSPFGLKIHARKHK